MKIWVTRNSANEILFGGLERLQIWFRKPKYYSEIITEKYRDTAFGDLTIDQYPYYRKIGWEQNSTLWTGENSFLSFGKIFGYSDGENSELAKYVWSKLCDHFNNKLFDTWDIMDRSGETKIEDFLLEIDLDMKLKTNEY